jgi:Flp pilus assembly pilin Flp
VTLSTVGSARTERGETRAPKGEAGASSVEYGLIAVAIAALITVVVFALGGVVEDLFSGSCTTFEAKASTGQGCGS